MEGIQHLVPKGLPASLQVVAATLILGLIYSFLTRERSFGGFPIVSLEGKSPKKSWMFHGRETLAKGLQQWSGPFQVITGTGPKIVLPNRFADEIRNDPSLNLNQAFSKDFFVDYPGFEPFWQGLHDDSLIQETVRVKLTQSLNLITDDLVEETTASLHDILGEGKEWHTIKLKDDVLDLVARLSSRVFLGRDLCRNKRWLEISKSYTVDAFVGSLLLRFVPFFLRPVVYWFIPQCTALRKAIRDAHKIIDPEVARRKAIVDQALAAGQKPPKVADTIGWMYEVARGRKVDFVAAQLSLTLAAIHTTTEVTGQALLDLCEHPEVAQQLREEAIQVLGEGGWAKTTLYKLKLMDSFLKESQRCAPLSSASMNRYVEKDLKLSDGTAIPKGSRIFVCGNFMGPEIYPEPEKFDAARFLKLRQQPGQENSWQFVTTSPDHILFGHGQHACPGRFFASNEVKIALCHLLLKYDWRFVPGEGRPAPQAFESSIVVNPNAQVQVRRRLAEIDLDNLKL
ncbi:Dihydromonacolin L monooxygenase [Diplogelasinospora grovesii]|uniref:Dihydromonacolin L monooxygenase n=1 Tax=Diplogelasinospora grovesii TaxID=303347 RepID=A0AAN6N2M2_9PEZI|nr:Dihydromonacolin L monooxygenase [Diplogelasinospora grovesii]